MAIELTTAATGQISGIKASLFLDNVDNTSDLDKPVSTAQQAYITGISGDLQTTIDGLDASHHVTYNGATGDVNLGVHKIVATTGEFTNLDISSNIVVGGTVDGRDVAADGAIIDGLGTISTFNSGDFVDVYNNQTISGQKTFSQETIFSDPSGIRVDAINSNGTNGYILFNETLDVRDQIIQWGSQGYFHNPASDIIRMSSPFAGDMLDFDGANSLLVGYKPLHLRTTAFVGTDLTVSGNSYITGSLDVDTSATIGTNLTVGDKLTVGTTLASNVGYFYFQDDTPYTASAVQLQQDATVRVFNPSTTANTCAGILLGNRSTSTTWCGMLSVTPSANNAELAFVIEDSDTITEMVRINEVGLGVNQNNPSYALDVAGDGNFTTSLGVGTDLTVGGHLSAATKSFLIDNPTKEGKKLQYGVVESDQHSVFVRGKTDKKIIELPEEWEWLVHEDSVTVQLTPIGKPQQLYIIEQNNKIVHVGGVEGEFNYTIYGERKDVAKLETEV